MVGSALEKIIWILDMNIKARSGYNFDIFFGQTGLTVQMESALYVMDIHWLNALDNVMKLEIRRICFANMVICHAHEETRITWYIMLSRLLPPSLFR